MKKEEVVKIGKRGQITIPADVRKKENLRKGDFLELSEVGGVLTLRKVEKKPNILNLFKEVGDALDREGYSQEDSLELADEVKKEVSK